MKRKVFLCIAIITLMLSACTNSNANSNANATGKVKDLDFKCSNITTAKYRNDDSVHYLIAVKYKGGYDAEVIMYEKDQSINNIWTETLRCDGIVGKNGIDKTKEGDSCAPTGDYGVGKAFGLKKNPGTKLEYLDIDENLYCCGDETAYNKLISIKDYSHECNDGEHMIEYSPEYNYGFEIGYNSECEFGKGSAIFFHCKGVKAYTGGCIAVSEENMKYILTKIDKNTRVIINYSD